MGSDNASDKILHLTSGLRSEAEMKVEQLYSDTIWHSKSQHLIVTDWSEAVTSGGMYASYTCAGLNGTPPTGTSVITIARQGTTGNFVNFDGLTSVIRPVGWDLGGNFSVIHLGLGAPNKVYRFWVVKADVSPTEIVAKNTGIYFDTINTVSSKILIVDSTNLPSGFVSQLNVPYSDSGTSKRFVVTSDSISSLELTNNSISAKNSSGQPIATADGRELSVMYETSVDMRPLNTGYLSVYGATCGKSIDITITPNITGQVATEVMLYGIVYADSHIGVETYFSGDAYGNNSYHRSDSSFKIPSVGSTISIVALSQVSFVYMNIHVEMYRVSTNVFRFSFYHYCNSSGRNYCKVGNDGGFVGDIRFLS